MKIIQVCSTIGNNFGGEKFCYELSRHLVRKGHRLQLAAAFQDVHKFKENNPQIVPVELQYEENKLQRKLFFDYFHPHNKCVLEKQITKAAPDLVHFHNIYGIGGELVAAASRLVPTVVTLHDTFVYSYRANGVVSAGLLEPFATIHRYLMKRFFRDAWIVSPSTFLKNAVEKNTGLSEVTHIPNGFEVPQKNTTYEKRIVFVGRVSAPKGIAEVLPILDDIRRDFGWSIDIVGDGALLDELQTKYSNIRFYGFSDPTLVYEKASILVFPSTIPENFPYVVLEGMGWGMGVVARDLGGVRDMLDESTGFLYNSLPEFESIIRNLVRNPRKIQVVGNRAQKAVARYTWENCVNNYLKLYHKILA